MRKDPWSSEYKSHQGNVGLGRAIAYYTANCIPVMLPLNDTQKYDLVIDDEGLKRVQIKTTRGTNQNGVFLVQLKHSGGSDNRKAITNFDNTASDILFVVTIEGTMYEIPTSEIQVKTQLTLTKEWDRFIVKF